MSLIWHLFLTFVLYLPWLMMAAMAALALRHKKASTPLLLQAAGAVAIFILALGQWLIVSVILHWLFKDNPAVLGPANVIFQFLLFMSLVIFTVGYCLERWQLGRPAPVTATRVE